MSKKERLEEFLRRLDSAEPCGTAEEAFDLITSMLNSVEDEFTTIPYDPSKWMSDGRMYPPQPDSARKDPDRSEFVRYRSRGHNTYIGADGTIEIHEMNGQCLLAKPGAGILKPR